MNLKTIYLLLAIVGALLPFMFFTQHFESNGIAMPEFVAAAFANPVAGGFTSDLLISSVVFWVLMFSRRRAGQGPGPFLFIAVNILIGLSCALPAYLYVCEKHADMDRDGPERHS